MTDFSLVNDIVRELELLYEDTAIPSIDDMVCRLPNRTKEEIESFFENFDKHIQEITQHQRKMKQLRRLKSEQFYSKQSRKSDDTAIKILDSYYQSYNEDTNENEVEELVIRVTK